VPVFPVLPGAGVALQALGAGVALGPSAPVLPCRPVVLQALGPRVALDARTPWVPSTPVLPLTPVLPCRPSVPSRPRPRSLDTLDPGRALDALDLSLLDAISTGGALDTIDRSLPEDHPRQSRLTPVSLHAPAPARPESCAQLLSAPRQARWPPLRPPPAVAPAGPAAPVAPFGPAGPMIAQDFQASFDLHLLGEVKYTLIRAALVDVLTHAKMVVVEGVAAPTAPDTPMTRTAASNPVKGLRNPSSPVRPSIPRGGAKGETDAADPPLTEAYMTDDGCRSLAPPEPARSRPTWSVNRGFARGTRIARAPTSGSGNRRYRGS
jgi:hypothetical protein